MVTLKSGKTFQTRIMDNGATEILGEMSAAEWDEYCAQCVEASRATFAKAAKMKANAKAAYFAARSSAV